MAVSASQVVFAIDFFDVMWFGCKTDLVEILGRKQTLHMLVNLDTYEHAACGMWHVQVFSCMVSASLFDRLANSGRSKVSTAPWFSVQSYFLILLRRLLCTAWRGGESQWIAWADPFTEHPHSGSLEVGWLSCVGKEDWAIACLSGVASKWLVLFQWLALQYG